MSGSSASSASDLTKSRRSTEPPCCVVGGHYPTRKPFSIIVSPLGQGPSEEFAAEWTGRDRLSLRRAHPHVPFSGLVQAHTPGESRAFAPAAMEGTGETASLAEQRGFEPPVPFARVRMIFGEEKGPWVIGVVSETSSFFQGGPA